MKRTFTILLAGALALAMTGCGPGAASSAGQGAASSIPGGYDPGFSQADLDSTWSAETATTIRLDGDIALVDGAGAAAVEGGVKISAGGVYVLSGTLDDGRVVADVEMGEPLKLVLNGAHISCSTSAPLYIANGDAVVVLAEDSVNSLRDGVQYQYPNRFVEEPNACLYGDDNLTINGTGELHVYGNYNNGIGTKDELRIVSGRISVQAVNNALKGNDCVLIQDGAFDLESQGDGIKSDDTSQEGHGLISITGGSFLIIVGDDALQASSRISITAGQVITKASGKKINCNGVVTIPEGILQ